MDLPRKGYSDADTKVKKGTRPREYVTVSHHDLERIRAGQKPKNRGALPILQEISASVEAAQEPYWRPQTRTDCLEGGRNTQSACPYVGCAHHLYLDVTKNGGLQINFPNTPVHEMPVSCALDVADMLEADGDPNNLAYEKLGELLHLSTEAVRKYIVAALTRLRANQNAQDLEETRRGPQNENGIPDELLRKLDHEE